MATNFPSGLDSLVNPNPTDTQDSPSHSAQHTNSNDAIEAIQAKIGVDSSAITSSLDYLVTNPSSSDPGHVHTLSDGATDVTATAVELNVLDGITVGVDDLNSVNPVGTLLMSALTAAPTGYLLCDGSAVSRTTYSVLFAAIGTTYGVGDGSTTFNIPDLRGRVALGKDDMGGASADRVTSTEADNLGGAEGSENHTLTEAELPVHEHGSPVAYENGSTNRSAYGIWGNKGNPTGLGSFNGNRASGTTSSGSNPRYGKTTETGSGDAHNNMQPYITLNYIIRY